MVYFSYFENLVGLKTKARCLKHKLLTTVFRGFCLCRANECVSAVLLLASIMIRTIIVLC